MFDQRLWENPNTPSDRSSNCNAGHEVEADILNIKKKKTQRWRRCEDPDWTELVLRHRDSLEPRCRVFVVCQKRQKVSVRLEISIKYHQRFRPSAGDTQSIDLE